jgi:hypothetical protein
MAKKLPADDAILASVATWGQRTPTYVVRNRLAMDGFSVETPWVLRQLKRLERAGRVERVPSSYAVMLVWRVVPTPEAGGA